MYYEVKEWVRVVHITVLVSPPENASLRTDF